ncbi:MAG: PaaX family transcriptional regulator C-terminal domain-containing protein [Pseudomonadota bacterium]
MTIHASPTPEEPARGSALDRAVAAQDRGGLRAWSLVTTVFGDAAAPRGGTLPLAAVQEVVGRLGVEPGALRTAMSRLARDGWLARERRGRTSFYALTETKRDEWTAATRRIYAAGPPAWSGGWEAAAPDPGRDVGAGLRAAGFAEAAPGFWLRPDLPGAPPAPRGASVFAAPSEASRVSRALIDAGWPSGGAARRFEEVARLAEALGADLPHAPDPLEALAARTLLLHAWRRAVLAGPDLPAALRPEGWPGERARAAVRALYWRLVPASEAWLDGALGPSAGAAEALAGRFGGSPD